VESVEETLGWPLRQPGWFWKSLVMGLFSLVPIVGWIAAAGWMLATYDNLRGRRLELPRPGLHLRRGWRLFAVLGVYSLLAIAVANVLALPGFLFARTFHDTAVALLGVLFVLIGTVLGVLCLLLVSTLLLPAIVRATDRGGLRAGLDLRGVLREVGAHREPSIGAGLLLVVAYALAGAGALACGAGAILTTGYSLLVMATVLSGYEHEAGPA
jgi:hypothetical protein